MFTKSCTENNKFIKLEKIIFFLFGRLFAPLEYPRVDQSCHPALHQHMGIVREILLDASAVLYVVKYAML